MRDPAALLARLDRYEGAEYRRIRVTAKDEGASHRAPASKERIEPGSRPSGRIAVEDPTGSGVACWTYAWAQAADRLIPLRNGWPA